MRFRSPHSEILIPANKLVREIPENLQQYSQIITRNRDPDFKPRKYEFEEIEPLVKEFFERNETLESKHPKAYDFIRNLDIAISGAFLRVSGPKMVRILESNKDPSTGERAGIFRQERYGMGGVLETISKFKTMSNAEEQWSRKLRETDHSDEQEMGLEGVVNTTLSDQLRSSNDDELKQLHDILRGRNTMSLVGGRPKTPEVLYQMINQAAGYGIPPEKVLRTLQTPQGIFSPSQLMRNHRAIPNLPRALIDAEFSERWMERPRRTYLGVLAASPVKYTLKRVLEK